MAAAVEAGRARKVAATPPTQHPFRFIALTVVKTCVVTRRDHVQSQATPVCFYSFACSNRDCEYNVAFKRFLVPCGDIIGCG